MSSQLAGAHLRRFRYCSALLSRYYSVFLEQAHPYLISDACPIEHAGRGKVVPYQVRPANRGTAVLFPAYAGHEP